MVGTLRTLKARPLQEQVETIEALAERNLALFDAVKSEICPRPEHSVVRVSLVTDKTRVVRAALLAVMAADIGTIPDGRRRTAYLQRLEQICERLGVAYADVVTLARHTSALEEMLERARP